MKAQRGRAKLSVLAKEGWILGMGPMPWTINAEIYPQWARSFGGGMASATNWLFNLLVSSTFLTLTDFITTHGISYLKNLRVSSSFFVL